MRNVLKIRLPPRPTGDSLKLSIFFAHTALALGVTAACTPAVAATPFNYDGSPITLHLAHHAPALHSLIKNVNPVWIQMINVLELP